MVSFIVIAKEKSKRETYVKSFADDQKINLFDITLIEKDAENKTTTQSIGIETVKLIQKNFFSNHLKVKTNYLLLKMLIYSRPKHKMLF